MSEFNSDLKQVLQFYHKTTNDLNDYIDTLRKWITSQPHLPEMPPERLLLSFLIGCKFSIEKTKKKLDMYYTIKTMIPEFFAGRSPKLDHMKEVLKYQYTAWLPKLTPEGYRVMLLKVNCDSNKLNYHNFMLMRLRYFEATHDKPLAVGDIYIEDLSAITLGHTLKANPTVIKNTYLVFFNSFPNRMKAFHFVNAPPYFDRVLAILKQIMKPKLAARIHVYQSIEDLKQFVPLDMLPVEYGGKEFTFQQLQEKTVKFLEDFQPRFDELDLLKTDESKRPSPLENDEVLGYYGSFRNIDID